MNKTKTIASGCWYAARHRAIPYIGKHAFALLTFLYFFFILGVGGGVDAWLLDDPKAVFMMANRRPASSAYYTYGHRYMARKFGSRDDNQRLLGRAHRKSRPRRW